jgi:ABC-type multidrug transport system fused ATPase/permease subunit
VADERTEIPALPRGETLRNVARTLAMVANIAPRALLVYVLTQCVSALCDVALVWVARNIIDAVVYAAAHRGHEGAARDALFWVALEFGVVATQKLLAQIDGYLTTVLRSELGLHVNARILEKALNVSYAHFEDPDFANRMTQARREASQRPFLMFTGAVGLCRDALVFAGYTALLSSLGPWAMIVLTVSAVPAVLGEGYFGRLAFERQSARTQRNRQLFYLESVLTQESTVKEVKLFSLGRWLTERYRQIHLGFHAEESALAGRRARWLFVLSTLSSVALYGAYVVVASRAAHGVMTLGAMTLYLAVFSRGQALLQRALGALARMYEHDLYMSNLLRFLTLDDDEPDRALVDLTAHEATRPPPSVCFEHVSFRYPGATRDVLNDVSLTLAAGETVALVGRNGAGKTSLVKLLVGLYRPTAGRILLDGVDTATLHPSEVRQRVGVIFQDFVRFQFSAGENVGVGWLPRCDDRAAIERAIDDAGAREVIDRLAQGIDTPLGRAFGGDDLSVGQWQRVALARAFMRPSALLVLDEPTASLDAESEHEVFQRFKDLKAGRTALLITHRFASVRMADRVVVLERGAVIEEGTHGALIEAGGAYAAMFRTQAEGYLDTSGAKVNE